MKLPAIIAAGALLTGCAGQEKPQTHVVYQTIEKPVAVACVPASLRPKPDGLLTADQLARMDGPQRYASMAADWLQRVARMNDTEPVIAACR